MLFNFFILSKLKNHIMKNLLLLFTFAFAISLNAINNPNDFEELKKLEGKWAGTLERTDGTSDVFILDYSITSNGSALLEESNTGGVEMLTIFNFQNDELLLTHYCGLQNKPISKLSGSKKGVLSFTTDSEMSGLSPEKDTYVTSWEINLMPEDENKISYHYTVSGPDGVVFSASSELTRI
jgi:hypothetical protein